MLRVFIGEKSKGDNNIYSSQVVFYKENSFSFTYIILIIYILQTNVNANVAFPGDLGDLCNSSTTTDCIYIGINLEMTK